MEQETHRVENLKRTSGPSPRSEKLPMETENNTPQGLGLGLKMGKTQLEQKQKIKTHAERTIQSRIHRTHFNLRSNDLHHMLLRKVFLSTRPRLSSIFSQY